MKKLDNKMTEIGTRKALLAVAVSLFVSGCANQSAHHDGSLKKQPAASAADLASQEIVADDVPDPESIKYRGTDQTVKLPKREEPIRFVGDAVTLGFENAPLSEVTHAVLSDILGLDYLIDGPIPGEVTLRTRSPIPRDQLLGVLESLLKANNVLLIRGENGRYIVTSSQNATKLSPQIVSKDDIAAGFSTVIVPLQYISATDMAAILKPLAEERTFVRVDDARNLLMLAGTQTQLIGWLDIVNTFDVDMLEGMSVGLFPLQHSGVEEVVDALNELLTQASGGDDGKGGLSNIVRVLPFIRLNSVLVITPRAHYLDKLETWIERLDRAPENGAEKRLYVYPVQNTTASRLADLLNSIYSENGQGGGNQNNAQDNRSVAPGMSRESVSGGSSSNRSGMGRSSGGTTGGMSGGSSFGSSNGGEARASVSQISMDGQNGSLGSEVRVVADDENNSLMIYSTGMQYKAIKAALEKLDTPPTQVLIEASIIEVTLTDELQYGLEWTFNGQIGGSEYSGTGFISDGAFDPTGGALGQIANGFSYSIAGGAGDIVAVLQALSNQSLVNVISSPSVMVLDNNTAYIHVGDQVPVSQGSTVSTGGNVTQNISYKDTGVKLSVRPSVNAGGLVTLDVEQSVTDVGQIDVTGNRRFLERNIMSRVAVRSGESVVLGGLIRENVANQGQGVPWLHELPVLGPLFGSTTETDNRTELLVIITPRALYNDAQLRDVSAEMRSRVRNLELIESNWLE